MLRNLPVIPTTIFIWAEIVQVPHHVEGSYPPVRREGEGDQDDESHGGGAAKNKEVVDQNSKGLLEKSQSEFGSDTSTEFSISSKTDCS